MRTIHINYVMYSYHLLHDADGVPGAGARLVEALPGLIEALSARGYALVPLRDLL